MNLYLGMDKMKMPTSIAMEPMMNKMHKRANADDDVANKKESA